MSGLAPGGNLSGLDLGQGGGPGMKDPGGGQQSRFKWMMEGHSPSSSPDAIAAMHKNGTPAYCATEPQLHVVAAQAALGVSI